MKRTLLTLLFSGLCTLATMAQAPLGMNYQAVIRNSTGEVVANQQIGLQLSVLQGSSSGTSVYSETFTPTTNEFGLVNVILGQGKSKSGDYSAINWSTANYYLKVELDLNGGSSYQTMGVTQLLSVPYANFAFSSKTIEGDGGNATISGTLQVVSDGTNSEEVPIFQVKNSKGETVFAVYENGVEILIDETGGAKTKGAFAISGKTTTKGTQEILTVTPELTQIYVDEPTTKTKGGFAISGRTTTKEGEADIFTVTPSLTQVFVEETTTKTKGGFAISGRTTTKSTGTYDVFTVVPERTDVYVKPSPSKNALPIGFSVSGLDVNYEPNELFSISEQGTYVATTLATKPKVATNLITNIQQTSANIGGSIVDQGSSKITTMGILYYKSSMQQPTLAAAASLNPSDGGIVTVDSEEDLSSVTIYNLSPNTIYKALAFATNGDKLTGYGVAKEFKTLRATKLTINVTDDLEAPLNALVTVWPQGAQTPITSGPLSTHNLLLADGYMEIRIEAEGYEDEVYYEYTLMGDQTIDVQLVKTTTPKVVFIITNQYGQPVNEVNVSVDNSNEYTRPDGKASFYLSPGDYEYMVESYSDGYETTSGNITVTETPAVQYVNVTMTENPKITIIVLGPDGLPLAEQEVEVSITNGEDYLYGFLYNGIATIYGVTAGEWEYSIDTYMIYPTKTGTISITGAPDQTVTIRLDNFPTEYKVTILVTNDEDKPLNDAKVTFGNELYHSVKYTSDPDFNEQQGEVTFLGVPESSNYNLLIEKEGFPNLSDEFPVDRYSSYIVEPGHIKLTFVLVSLATPY